LSVNDAIKEESPKKKKSIKKGKGKTEIEGGKSLAIACEK